MEQGQGSVRGLVTEGGKASQGRFCSDSTYDLLTDNKGYPLLSVSWECPLT